MLQNIVVTIFVAFRDKKFLRLLITIDLMGLIGSSRFLADSPVSKVVISYSAVWRSIRPSINND